MERFKVEITRSIMESDETFECADCQIIMFDGDFEYMEDDILCSECFQKAQDENISKCATCNTKIREDDFRLFEDKGIACNYYCRECKDKGEYPDGCFADVDAQDSDIVCSKCRLKICPEDKGDVKDKIICADCLDATEEVK